MGSLDLKASYGIRWRNHAEDIELYRYNREAQNLIPVGNPESLLSFVQDADEVGWLYQNQYVLFIGQTGVVAAGEFTTKFRPNDYPRLDFVRQLTDRPQIIASLTMNGRLAVLDAFENPLPSGDDQMLFFGLVSFSHRGLYAAELREIGLLAYPQGYISEPGEPLIEV